MKYRRTVVLFLVCISLLGNIKAYVYINIFWPHNEWPEDYCPVYSRTRSISTFNGAFGCDANNVRIIDTFETRLHRYISVLVNQSGKKFIVKQETRNLWSRHLAVAREKLGAMIAESAAVLANRVEIIPAHCVFPGKWDMALPATIHEFVPGVLVRLLLPKELRVCIQQELKPTTPKDRRGLTRQVIKDMATHNDLCKIAAFDTFTANIDRHRGNFLYDQESNRFIAIDLESGFYLNLAEYACKCIQSILDDQGEKLSEQELQGLCLYRDVLYTLVQSHTSASIYDHLVTFSNEAGIFEKPFQTAVVNKLKHYKVSIKDNYDSCKQLVDLLDCLMRKYNIVESGKK